MKALFASILTTSILSATAAGQSTAFTYQGRLASGGAPASGLHDFRFKLFDAASGGNQIGTTTCADNLSVSDGLFSVQLDFGRQFATPSPRYLEIQVRADTGLDCGSSAGLVTLSPRQPLTAAPLATHARSAFALDAADGSPANALIVDNSGNIGIGASAPTARLDVRGGPIAVEHLGDEADLLWLNSERNWVFRQEGTGASAALKLQSVGGGGNKNFLFQTDGAVGIRPTSGNDLYVPGSEENLRIVRGAIDPDGTVLVGTGFTCTRIEQAKYRITFTPPFAGVPVVTATSARPVDALSGAMIDYWSGGPTANGVTIVTRTDNGWSDHYVNFIAIGPR
ncbi:MAG TPA: hypothetical protein VFF69_06135 [Phycisphaerales bacterium]|nr:hypothetical protein [Phycisphaerales bacterium]